VTTTEPSLGMSSAPYVGPRPFERSESKLFYGRDKETEVLLSLIISQKVVLVYSASGVGKSSLIRARVIPTVECNGLFPLGPYRISRLNGYLESIAELIAFEHSLTGVSRLEDVLAALSDKVQTNKSDLLPEQRNYLTDSEIPCFVIFIDQFEELFADSDYANYKRFFQELAILIDSCTLPRYRSRPSGKLFNKCMVRVVLSMRADYIDRLEPFCDLIPGLRDVRFRLDPLDKDSALQAIKRPVEVWDSGPQKVRYADGVAEEIVDQLLAARPEPEKEKPVQSSEIEPVQLQVVCLDLWNSLPQGINPTAS
jgi:hypothetical protein